MKFNHKQTAEQACAAFDREHGSADEHDDDDNCGDPKCPGCNKDMTKEEMRDNLLGEKMMVSIVKNPDDPDGVQVGTVVDLPSSKNVAEVMLITIVKTMAIASKETPEDVVMRLAENLSANLVQDPKSYKK